MVRGDERELAGIEKNMFEMAEEREEWDLIALGTYVRSADLTYDKPILAP